jgi:AraC-like DNA-binding protein/mannose-6-phosphate isomerase-like protein (cupin superfamily)
MQYSIYETITNDSRFPISAFVISLDSVTWHWHNEYEFISVVSGAMILKIQSDEYRMKTGDLALINSREIHALQKTSEECLCMIVQVSEEFFSSGEMEDEESELHFYLNSTEDETLECGFELLYYRMAKIVYESIKDTRISKFRIRAQVCSLIADLMEFSVYDRRIKNKDVRDQQNILIALISYLEANLMNDSILDKACTEFGISRKTMDRIVNGILGISSKDLLDNLRIEQAKKLLKYSTKSISYIMDVCGYASENTFYRSFKKYIGSTPKDYRESVTQDDDKDELKGYLDYETPRVMAALKEIIEVWENRNYR